MEINSETSSESDERYAELETEIQSTREQLQETQERYLGFVNKLARENPSELIRMAAETVLDIQGEEVSLFAGLIKPEQRESLFKMYSDLAKVMLAECERKRAGDKEQSLANLCEHVSLEDWVTLRFSADRYLRDFETPNVSSILSTVFDRHEAAFGYALGDACDRIYHGVPLFECSRQTGEFSAIPFTHDDYIYLAKKGEHCDMQPRGAFPYWASKYFFKREHLEVHKIFFGGIDDVANTDKSEAVATLRAAFRHHIGFDSQSFTPRASRHSTRMMGLLDKALERFYGSNFDPKNRDTWTSQTQVIDWIQNTFPGTSEADAKAIDAITRPDEARRKS